MQPLFLFKLFGIPFFSYTSLVLVGVVLALVMASVQVRRAGKPARWVSEAAAWLAIFGLIGGRLVHLLYNWDYYLERPAQVLRFGDGGLSFVGVLLGAALALWLWSRYRQMDFWQAADWAALPVAVLATFAWLGAFMHGSQYGAPVENGLALELHDTFGVIAPRWPTQLLAAAWSALLGLTLIAHQPRRARAGKHATLFLSAYSAGLFMLDFTRGDGSLYILGMRLTQLLYIVLFSFALWTIGRKSPLP